MTAESPHSPLCAQAPGTTSRTWTASSPRYPLCCAWRRWVAQGSCATIGAGTIHGRGDSEDAVGSGDWSVE